MSNDNGDDISGSSIPTVEECEDRLRDSGMKDEYFQAMLGTKNPEKV